VFDAIISEGVLHHTPSTERAFKSLARLLAPSGEIMIYVYRKKAPLREFADDYVRELLQGLPPDEAWERLRPMTALARELAQLDARVTVQDDVDLLGIPAGTYDVQRLVYWHFAKMFWNDEMSFEENNHVNFDWYAPRYAHRHTRDEVESWFESSDLEIVHFDEQEAGFTVRGVRR
jgi:SAM-dependent methyltransferase